MWDFDVGIINNKIIFSKGGNPYSGMSNSQAREKIDAGEKASIKMNKKLIIKINTSTYIIKYVYLNQVYI